MNCSTVETIRKNDFSNYNNVPCQNRNVNEKVWRIAKAVFLTIEIFFDPIVDFFTQGLSDFLALETLRHGTSLQNYISIRLNGPDPKRGGGNSGASKGADSEHFIKESKGYFFLSKDSESYLEELGSFRAQLYNRCLPSRMYCGLSASTTISGKGFPKKLLQISIIVFNVLFVPTLKFRFLPEDISGKFINDPDNRCILNPGKGLAYRTTQSIGTDHIGLKGILTQGLKGNLFGRMKAHPGKVCWGLVKLINPVGITILFALGTYLAGRKCSNILQKKIQTTVHYFNKTSKVVII